MHKKYRPAVSNVHDRAILVINNMIDKLDAAVQKTYVTNDTGVKYVHVSRYS